MIRVAIVASAMAVRAGLRALLSEDPSIQVVAEGTSLAELNESRDGVEVLIWSPATAQNLETLRMEIGTRNLEESTALLAIHSDPHILDDLYKLPVRAWGVIDPEASQGELIASVHALNEGLATANPAWLRQALERQGNRSSEDISLVEPLTEREIEILQLLANGLTNKQIAGRLKISAHTVKFHVSSIYTKMGTTNRVETVNLGLKLGLIVL